VPKTEKRSKAKVTQKVNNEEDRVKELSPIKLKIQQFRPGPLYTNPSLNQQVWGPLDQKEASPSVISKKQSIKESYELPELRKVNLKRKKFVINPSEVPLNQSESSLNKLEHPSTNKTNEAEIQQRKFEIAEKIRKCASKLEV